METKFNYKNFYNNYFRQHLQEGKETAGEPENSFEYITSLNINKDATILDIGTFAGFLPARLYQNGYLNVKGIDIAEEAILYGQKKYPFLKDNLISFAGQKLPFPDNCFDVILMFDVIEHIPNIKTFLEEEVGRVLKKDGLLIFQTPNKITNIVWTLCSQKKLSTDEHCSLQTLPSLKKLLRDSSFTDIKIEKNNLRTELNKEKITKKIGSFFLILLPIFNLLPLSMFPNFWGTAKKS